jgi:hypothetical protein
MQMLTLQLTQEADENLETGLSGFLTLSTKTLTET